MSMEQPPLRKNIQTATCESSSEECASLESALENPSNGTDSERCNQPIKSKRQKIIQIVLLLTAIFSVLSGSSMLAPFFPQEAKKKGLSDTNIGIIFAFFPAVVFVMAPIYGYFVSIAIT